MKDEVRKGSIFTLVDIELTRDQGTQLQVVTAGAVAGLVSRYVISLIAIHIYIT